MARNGSGVETIPNTLVSGTTITASALNQNFVDLGAEITNSVAADGQTTITAPIKFANGTAGAPSVTFASDTDTGFFRAAANSIGIAAGGASIGSLSDAGLIMSATASFILTASFSSVVKSASTSHWLVPVGSTAQQPGTPVEGMFRQNSTTHIAEMYNGSSWAAMQALLVQGTFKNLSIKVASNTTVTVAADFVATTDGSSYQVTAVSSTINLATTGADALDTGTVAIDTWYAIWVIAKTDGTTKCLASTSATAPTMPATYTFKARVGWVRTIHGSATLYGTWQFGRNAQYVLGLAQTAALPTVASGTSGTTTDAGVSLTASSVLVPTTATRANIILYSDTHIAILAPNGSYGGYNNATGKRPPLTIRADNTGAMSCIGWLLLESANVYYASSGASSSAILLGWEDNI